MNYQDTLEYLHKVFGKLAITAKEGAEVFGVNTKIMTV